MANSGYKGYTTLEEYYVDDNSATGTTKPNVSTDPDYIAPVYDDISCPVINTTIALDQYSISPSQAQGTSYVAITSNYDELNFGVDVAWIGLVPSAYSENLTLAIYIDENTTFAVRYGLITISHGVDSLTTILITQAG